MSDPSVQIAYSLARKVNIAFDQNAIPVGRELSLQTDRELADVAVQLASAPPFATPGIGERECFSPPRKPWGRP